MMGVVIHHHLVGWSRHSDALLSCPGPWPSATLCLRSSFLLPVHSPSLLLSLASPLLSNCMTPPDIISSAPCFPGLFCLRSFIKATEIFIVTYIYLKVRQSLSRLNIQEAHEKKEKTRASVVGICSFTGCATRPCHDAVPGS